MMKKESNNMKIRVISFLNDPLKAEIANIDINVNDLEHLDIFETILDSLRDDLLIDLVHHCDNFQTVPSENVPKSSDDTLLVHFAFKALLINQAIESKQNHEIDAFRIIENPLMKHLEYF